MLTRPQGEDGPVTTEDTGSLHPKPATDRNPKTLVDLAA